VEVDPESPSAPLPRVQAAALEATAVRLAQAAGTQITAAVNGELTVQFKKTRPHWAANSNPVSQVDQSVERLIRAQLLQAHPGHAVIGEEQAQSGPRDAAISWVIDPVDGTCNFINGVPLYACSIGVLHEGWPVAGAIWCAASHAVGPGVYHAHAGGPLCFNGRPVVRRKPGNWRGLAAEHGRSARYGGQWDIRVLGTSAVEFAWVACGVLRLAHMPRPGLWDAAAGLALLHAAGCSALTWEHGRWAPLVRFRPPSTRHEHGTLAAWQQPVLIGAAEDLTAALQDPRSV
jgi:myo-inositol-1(or 4)-monophosphatase